MLEGQATLHLIQNLNNLAILIDQNQQVAILYSWDKSLFPGTLDFEQLFQSQRRKLTIMLYVMFWNINF